MTEFIDERQENKIDKKKTDFVKRINNHTGETTIPITSPKTYDVVKLIRRKYLSSGLDLIVVYDENSEHTTNECWFLGHWNDGC